jgi:tight adherence protein C
MIRTLDSLQVYIGNHFTELAFILLAAGAVFVFSLGLSAIALAAAGPLRRRLRQIAPRETPQGTTTRLARLVQPIARYVGPRSDEERSRIGRMLQYAGYRSPNALSILYACRMILIVVLPLAVLTASPFFPKLTTTLLACVAIVAGAVGYLAPSVWLDHAVEARQRDLREGFPDALDLLVVCVESGLGLASALQRVADELSISHPRLGAELALVNAEMRAGVERSEALKNIATRTGLADIRGLVALLVQTLRLGTSVADALRVYSEEFRDKRMQAAEEQAALIGTKIIFPLVLCLFPCFFLVAVGPAIIRLAAVFSQLGH